MFTKRTVFVIGAGASREVGLPMGSGLKDTIAAKVNIAFGDGYNLSSGDRKIVQAVEQLNRANAVLDNNPHFSAGRMISAAMPQAISIDNYLHTHSDNQLIVAMGKLGITVSIIEAEANSSLNSPGERPQLDFNQTSGTWFNAFFEMASEGVTVNSVDHIFDNVGFIIFNYDRCVEYYLHCALQSYFQIDADRAANIMRRLDIVHPYGQVGYLPWQEGADRIFHRFGGAINTDRLPDVSGKIRTFTERLDNDEDVRRQITDMRRDAEVMVYLGFSFGQMNMQLMQIVPIGRQSIYGTAYLISPANRREIELDMRADYLGDLENLQSMTLANETCAQFLASHRMPILRGVR